MKSKAWGWIAIAGLALVLGGAGCTDDDDPPRDTGVVDKGKDEGGPICLRPPLSQCFPPPYGSICPDLWYCPGCTCTGATKVAACQPITGDCRWFCTGCYPENYVLCDENAPASVLGMCGYCFGDDAGPGKCDKLSDGGAGSPDAGTD